MRLAFDIEANGLEKPTQIWLIVCKDIDTGELHVFREVTKDDLEKKRFVEFVRHATLWIGHNVLGYDWPVINSLLGIDIPPVERIIDTLIISKMSHYSRDGHSIEQYGIEFGFPKGVFSDFSKYSTEMEEYCVRDVEICHRVYNSLLKYISNPAHRNAIILEHKFQLIVNKLHDNGFAFDVKRATRLLEDVTKELQTLDQAILSEFPPKKVLIKEFTPRETKYGTISKTSVPRSMWNDIHTLVAGHTYPVYRMVDFNPASHKQIIDVLHEAGWQPVEKTKTRIDLERVVQRAKYARTKDADLSEALKKLKGLDKYGWKISENNLSTLPEEAPAPARTLAQRIMLESRRRTLKEWLSLVHLNIKIEKKNIEKSIWTVGGSKITEGESTTSSLITDLPSKTIIEWLKSERVNATFVEENDRWLWITITPQEQHADYSVVDAIRVLDGLKQKNCSYEITSARIRGKFMGLGAWTHRMAHQNPNTANIPTDAKLYGKEMRSLWVAPKKRLLVGVDAEGIQLRIFAHYINDPEFTDALVRGKKDDKTDPHSLNQRVLGNFCKSRAIAKRFIFAFLLGAGLGKLAEILGCSAEDAKQALDRVYKRYKNLEQLKETIIPKDARRGYFIGLDGRSVCIPSNEEGSRRHLAMSGYLQNGEAVVMKAATVKFEPDLEALDSFLVDLVHDEWQTECPNNMKIALQVAELQANALKEVGEELKLNCPLAGSYWNDDHKDYTIGVNWWQTH